MEVHKLADKPTEAWKEISLQQKVIEIHVTTPKTTVQPDRVRFVCMSDTHSFTSHLKFPIPDGDIFLHAGDFTRCGTEREVIEFDNWLGHLPHEHKVVIAGNHELSFDDKFTHPLHKINVRSIPSLGYERSSIEKAIAKTNMKDKLTNCIYLQDNSITIHGIKIYGSPWQPKYCGWAFNLNRGSEILEKWNLIPDDVDILVTHTPPLGHGDLACSGVRAGCVDLLMTVQKRVKPKYHIFGHIHEGYGVTSDGKIIFINAATCNINYIPVNPPVVFDVKLPVGFKKS